MVVEGEVHRPLLLKPIIPIVAAAIVAAPRSSGYGPWVKAVTAETAPSGIVGSRARCGKGGGGRWQAVWMQAQQEQRRRCSGGGGAWRSVEARLAGGVEAGEVQSVSMGGWPAGGVGAVESMCWQRLAGGGGLEH
uniref:Uncharacterized protein n=1 Tax=Oryza barthii TaxID=65489 RepID=A0A0D3F7T6_9ORYZ